MTRAMTLRRSALLALRAAALLHLLMQLMVFLPTHWGRTDVHRDVTYVYTAAERVRTGQPLYWPWADYGPHVHTEAGPPYPFDRHPYPPPLATVLAPATTLPFATFARLWYVPLLLAFWVYAWCLARLALERADVWRVVIVGLILSLFPGTYRVLSLGQVDPILWALFGLAMVVPALRGAAFAASAAVKLYAGWPLLFAVKREGRRVLLPAAAVFAAAFLVSGVTLGFDIFFTWTRYMLPVISQGTFNADNVSISFAGLRLARLLGWDYVPGPLPLAARMYLTVVGIAAPLAAGWLTRSARATVQYSLVGCAAVLFAPLCWSSYLPLLLVPMAVGVCVWRERGGRNGPIGVNTTERDSRDVSSVPT
jgi:hypothetical protein